MRNNNRAVQVSAASLGVVAWVLSLLLALTDLGSRLARISAVFALAALQIGIVLVLVISAALVMMQVQARKGITAGRFAQWPLVIALVGTSCVLIGRLGISALEPTVLWLAPALLLAPAALTWELFRRYRSGARMSIDTLIGYAAAWCTVSAVCLIALSVVPARWDQLDLRTAGLLWVGSSILAIGGSAAVCAAVERRFGLLLRFLVTALCGLVVVLQTPNADQALAGTDKPAALPVLAAVLIVFALLTPISVVATGYAFLTRSSQVLTIGLRRLFGQSIQLLRKLRGVVSSERLRLLRFAAPGQIVGAPQMTKKHYLAIGAMVAVSFAFIGHGFWWASRVGWQPTGHAATLMMRAAQVGTADHPLIGMVTSLGGSGKGSHLGPLAMDVVAPFVRVFGVRLGALVAASLVTLVCWTVCVWAAWRAAGGVAAVAAWVMAAAVITLPMIGAFWDANNISISMLAITATILASWAAATATPRAWWLAVGLGSFCAQAYIPHALIIVGPVLWAGLVIAGSAREQSDASTARRTRRALWVGCGIAVVAWFQPALDVILHNGGNVRDLILEVSNATPSVGIRGIPQGMAWALAIPPRWGEITKSFAQPGSADDFIRGSLVSGFLVALLLGYLWWKTRFTAANNERQLRIITLLVLLGTGLNLTQLPVDYLRSFQLGWLALVSIFVWFSIFLSAFLALRSRVSAVVPLGLNRALRVGAFSLSAVAVLALGLSGPRRIEDVKGREFTIDALIDPLVEQTLDRLDTSEQVLGLRADGRLNEVATDTVLSNLIVEGLDARVEADPGGLHYGQRRMVNQWAGPMMWITSGLDPVKPEGKLLAAASVPGWSKQRFTELSRQVAQTVSSAPQVKLQPWADLYLVRYLSGWIPQQEVCVTAEKIRSGTYPLASLPPGLLLILYADLAFVTPQLGARTQAEVSGLIGQAPLEVWLSKKSQLGPISSNNLLRDGSTCAAEKGPS